MFAFAQQVTQHLPERHPLWILIVQVHYEAFAGLVNVAQHSRARSEFVAAGTYWKRPNMREEILHSYRQYVGSATFEPPSTTAEKSLLVTARNWYALVLMQMEDIESARRELALIGNQPTERPWHTLERYQKACNEAGIYL